MNIGETETYEFEPVDEPAAEPAPVETRPDPAPVEEPVPA